MNVNGAIKCLIIKLETERLEQEEEETEEEKANWTNTLTWERADSENSICQQWNY